MSKNSSELQKIRTLTTPELSNLYWKQQLSHIQIADIYKISPTAVRNLLLSRNIKSRTNAESQTAINHSREKVFNYSQMQLILGSLLGDACLNREVYLSNKTGKELISYKLCFYHSNKFIDYVLHKTLIGLSSKTKKTYKLNYRISGFGSLMVGFCYCHTPTLRKISPIFLNNKHKKRISDTWLEKINWPALAYWYQDDGSLQLNKDGRRTLAFHTENFKEGEVNSLRDLLREHGLNTTIGKNNGDKEQRVILAHRKKEVSKFLEKIRPFIIPCMRYKLRSEGITRYKKEKGICQQ